MLQRGIYVLLGITLFAAIVPHNPRMSTRIAYGILTLLIAMIGIFLAGRQVWLQSQPALPTEICLPGFAYMVQRLPLTQALRLMLLGADNCGVVTWRLWGWSIAHWSLVWFIAFALQGIGQLLLTYFSRPITRR